MNKYLFIPPFSNHAPHIHKGWISSYIKRIRLNCTQDIDFILNKHTFFLRLLVRGYDRDFLIPIFKQPINRFKAVQRLLQKINTGTKHTKTPTMIFKLRICNRTCRLKNKIKTCLRYTNESEI